MKQWRQLAPAFGRFLVVGLSGTLVNLSGLWVLVNVGVPQLISVLVAIELSIINNFVWNDCWTFRQAGGASSWLVRFGRFQLITSLTASLTVGLFVLLNQAFHLHYLLAQFTAIGLATLVNFVINSQLTWRLAVESHYGDGTGGRE